MCRRDAEVGSIDMRREEGMCRRDVEVESVDMGEWRGCVGGMLRLDL